MKLNKKMRGFMAGALALAVASPLLISNISRADSLDNGRVAYYTFDEQALVNNGSSEHTPTVYGKKWAENGSVSYVAGRSGEADDYAIDLRQGGLKLNENNLGDRYTVSLWVNPQSNFISWAQNICFLGYHNPEKWVSFAGVAGGSNAVFWSNDAVNNKTSWTQAGQTGLTKNQWTNVMITGDGINQSVYVNGEKKYSQVDVGALDGENQDVHIGVDNWDDLFTGYVDDVMVYNRVLSAGEIHMIATGQTPEQAFKDGEVTLSDMSVRLGKRVKSEVTVPSAVVGDSGLKLSYEVGDKSIAQVTNDGVVEGVGNGETTLTVTAKFGAATKTATAKVVVESLDIYQVGSYSFDGNINNLVQDKPQPKAVKLVSKDNWSDDASPVYGKGFAGTSAVEMNGDYGIKLNTGVLGYNYTVEFWTNCNVDQASNQIMIMLGQYNPENWFAISGDNGSGGYKAWLNGNGFSWKTQASPQVAKNTWTHFVLTGSQGKMTLYEDGKALGTFTTNDPMNVSGADVYLGVNNWDTEFNGLFENVKVYDVTFTEEEVKDSYVANFENAAKANLDSFAFLGKNASADKVRFDLNLPTSFNGMELSWTSSKPAIIGNDGKVVKTPNVDTEITFSASAVAKNVEKVSANIEFTVVAEGLDKTLLNELIAKAEAVNTNIIDDASKERLAEVIAEGKAAETFEEVDTAVEHIQIVLDTLVYTADFDDPFAFIVEPAVAKTVKAGEKVENLFTVPEQIASYVEVEYSTGNDSVATYADGDVTAIAAGNTIVTATVTSLSDGWAMEYSTALTVEAVTPVEPEDPGKDDPKDPENPPVVDPTEPTDPENPPVVDPTEPTDPENPPVVDPTEPTDPENPPVVDPTEPTDPTDPGEKPSVPAKPTKPAKPSLPILNPGNGDDVDPGYTNPISAIWNGIVDFFNNLFGRNNGNRSNATANVANTQVAVADEEVPMAVEEEAQEEAVEEATEVVEETADDVVAIDESDVPQAAEKSSSSTPIVLLLLVIAAAGGAYAISRKNKKE